MFQRSALRSPKTAVDENITATLHIIQISGFHEKLKKKIKKINPPIRSTMKVIQLISDRFVNLVKHKR